MKEKPYRSIPLEPGEITPKYLYKTRRQFMKQIGVVGLGALLASCAPANSGDPGALGMVLPGASGEDPADVLTAYEAVTGYCNFYEFTTNKETVDEMAQDFVTQPWSVQVDGLVDRPKAYSMEDILAKFTQEERIYRMRCVEAWSMVIPWIGFPLRKLLELVEPASDAKYVRFETLYDPDQMPGQRNSFFPFPYIEGLRLDEAMHDLTIMSTGLYGRDLSPQNGAPLRLVVPWKYGFKSIKSIVKIDLVGEMPTSLWMASGPSEYGFYANVNPNVPHPRWSQATERRIGESGRIDTLLFNGYEEEVASLYDGMDLSIDF